MVKSLFSNGVTVLMLGSVILTLVIISFGSKLEYDRVFYGINTTAAIMMLFLAFSLMATGCQRPSNRDHHMCTMFCNGFILMLLLMIIAAAIILNSIFLSSLQGKCILNIGQDGDEVCVMTTGREQIIYYLLLCTEVASLIYLTVVTGIVCKKAKSWDSSHVENSIEMSGHGNDQSDVVTNNLAASELFASCCDPWKE